jgi:hypothetical protein
MSSIEVRPFRRGDREQLTKLVNAHVQAVVPGVSVSVNTVMSQLERAPGEFIVDPWVSDRVTLVADQRRRVVAAAHLLRYGAGNEVGEAYRGRGVATWLVGQAADWLRLARVERLLDYAGAEDERCLAPCDVVVVEGGLLRPRDHHEALLRRRAQLHLRLFGQLVAGGQRQHHRLLALEALGRAQEAGSASREALSLCEDLRIPAAAEVRGRLASSG